MARTVTPAQNAVVTEAEAQQFTFKDASATAHTDEELDVLCRILNGVSAAIERYIGGPVIEQQYTEKYDGGTSRIFLRQRPVTRVISVKEDGNILTGGEDYYVYAKEGYLLRAAGGGLFWWAKGYPQRGNYGTWTWTPQGVEVTYKAGHTADVTKVPWDIKQAALLWIYAIWHSGPANLANILTETGAFVRPEGIPAPVAKLLEKYRLPAVASV